jgi:signal peptidase I
MNAYRSFAAVLDRRWPGLVQELPTLPEAGASLLRTIVVALFVLTFIMDPCMIPSASMEPTLLVGDFLLSNRQVYAPKGPIGRLILPYRAVHRGDVVVFYHPKPSLLVKRVVALPGDHLRIVKGRVFINGVAQNEPWESTFLRTSAGDDFPPAGAYSDPDVDPHWWSKMQSLTHGGVLTVPANEYFVLGDNRDHSDDSRFWGFVSRQSIFAKPLVIYFSLKPSLPPPGQTRADDRLEVKKDFPQGLTGFARWNRIFHVVH